MNLAECPFDGGIVSPSAAEERAFLFRILRGFGGHLTLGR